MLLGAMAACLVGVGTSLAADVKADVLSQVKQKAREVVKEQLEDVFRGFKIPDSCQIKFNAAKKVAQEQQQACVDSPTPDSPVGKFNKMTNTEALAYCGDLTGLQCAAKLARAQAKFCAIEAAKAIAKAKVIAAQCERCAKIPELEDDLVDLKNECKAK